MPVSANRATATVCLCFVAGYMLAGSLRSDVSCPLAVPKNTDQVVRKPAVDPKTVPTVNVQPPVAEGAKPKQGDGVTTCNPGDIVEVTAKEQDTVKIRRGLIRDIVSSQYGGSRTHDTTGLVDAFVVRGGLDLEVAGSVLGGNPSPAGTNVLTIKFRCATAEEKASMESPATLSSADVEFVRKTYAAWAEEGQRFLENPKSACFFEKDLIMPNLPATCSGESAEDGAKKKCRSEIVDAARAYGDKVGTLPANFHLAILCALSKVEHQVGIEQLQSFASKNQPVWLVRIADGVISWELSSKSDSWKHESDSFSILQMSLYTLEAAVANLRSRDPSFNSKDPIYLLINALDEPRVMPPEDMIPPVPPPASLLRDRHQGDAVPSAQWVDDWTQWGSKKTFSFASKSLPVMSWSTVPGWHRDVIVPNRHPGSCHDFFFDPRISEVPFEQKDDIVLFRAFSAACDRKGKGPRQRLVCFADDHKHQLVIAGKTITLDIGGGRGWGPTGSQKFMSPARQARHKYLLLVDGVVAAFRSTWLLQSGSVILACGMYKDVRTQVLKPWIHYIPFSNDLHDFEDALSVVVENPDYAKWVTRNAAEAGKLLSGHPTDGGATFDAHYFEVLLQYYPKLVQVTNDLQESRVRWSKDKKCDDWLSTTSRIRQCLPDTYACGANYTAVGEKKVNANYFGGSG
ncbi:O-glucosyltransferase rumi [Diplonema papillatum]|nr:O-glucosyltransferase rumi [Diplonema papillatum]